MNVKTTVILLLVFALGVAGFVLTRNGGGQNQAGPTDPGPDDRARPILDPAHSDPNKLSRIGFERGEGGGKLELSKSSGSWRVVNPNDFPADEAAVRELITLLQSLRGTATADTPAHVRDQHGLLLTFKDHEVFLGIGERTGAGRGVLTVSRGRDVQHLTTDDSLHRLLDNLDPRVFYAGGVDLPPMPDTLRIDIDSNGERSVLTQRDGRWWIGEGGNAERALADPLPGHASIRDYFELAVKMRITEHRAYDQPGQLAQFGLARPLISVRYTSAVTTTDGKPTSWTLSIGVPADPRDQTRFASYGPTGDPMPAVFVVPTDYAVAFGQSGTVFRDPRPVSTPVTLIETLRITRPDGLILPICFGTDGSVSADGGGGTAELSAAACADMIRKLADARASDYVVDGLDALVPRAHVEVQPRLGGEVEAFSILDDPEATGQSPTVLIRRGEEPVALRVPASSVAALLDPMLLYAE